MLKRFFYSAIVFVFLLICLFLAKNWTDIKGRFFTENESGATKLSHSLPIELLPKPLEKEELVSHPNFIIAYSENHKQALWTFQELKGSYTRGNASRYNLNFVKDPYMKSRSANWADFINTGYDRGHLIPAADYRCCDSLLQDTFILSNIAPFDSAFNRHSWVEVEAKTRYLARKHSKVYVFTGPIFNKEIYTIGRYNEVSIPAYFFKIIIVYNPKNPDKSKTVSYLMSNSAESQTNPSNYTCSIDQLEALSGLDFFSGLPEKAQISIESINQKAL